MSLDVVEYLIPSGGGTTGLEIEQNEMHTEGFGADRKWGFSGVSYDSFKKHSVAKVSKPSRAA